MTTPAVSIAGSLGNVDNLANGGMSFEFIDFLVPRGVKQVVFFLRITEGDGPVVFEVRRNGSGGFRRHVPTVTIPTPLPTEETIVVLDFPAPNGRRLRASITNNSAGVVSANLDVSYELPGRR